jgi:hypothetical protein
MRIESLRLKNFKALQDVQLPAPAQGQTQRFYTDWYPWRLLRVGWAVFMDAGRVRGDDVRGTTALGTLYDVGLGLRLSSPRSSGRSIVHIDLAFPLNGDPTTDSAQLVIETKTTF